MSDSFIKRDPKECVSDLEKATQNRNYIDGFECFKELAEVYARLGITDTTFLIMRNTPSLPITLDASMKILQNTATEQVREILIYLYENIDARGKQDLELFVREHLPEISFTTPKKSWFSRLITR